MPRTILITGAAGNIGGKVAAHFTEAGAYDLRLLDLHGAPPIIHADIAQYDESWAGAFRGVDTVLHFAGNPSGRANWAGAMSANILGIQHVLRAAREGGVRRVVFASTNQVMLGYRFAGVKVTTDMPPAPLSPYGVSKLFGEEAGRAFAEETGISFIALRIGYLQRGENLPGPWMKIGAWGQPMWLSNRDMMHAAERAIEAEDVPFAILNVMSDNEGLLFDLEHTRKTTGYHPQDRHVPVIDGAIIAEDEEAKSLTFAPGTWLDEYFHPVAP